MGNDFNQATALISRLMEGVGGSADAYEEQGVPRDSDTRPVSTQSRVLTVGDLPQTRLVGIVTPTKDAGSSVQPREAEDDWTMRDQPLAWSPQHDGDSDESCAYLGWEADEVPAPVSSIYALEGRVEESDELMVVHCAFQRAKLGSTPVTAPLDTGTYNVESTGNQGCFRITDAGKEREYTLEARRNMPELFGVPSEQLFIWVEETVNHRRLGYISEGWVFLLKN